VKFQLYTISTTARYTMYYYSLTLC
jgi:hypothetical protein